jgi:hypothetical protein
MERTKPLTRRQSEVLTLVSMGLCYGEQLHFRTLYNNVYPVKYSVPSDLECSRWIDVSAIVKFLKSRKLIDFKEIPIRSRF